MADPLGDAIKRLRAFVGRPTPVADRGFAPQVFEDANIFPDEEGFILPTASTALPPTIQRPEVGIDRISSGQPQRPLTFEEIQAMGRQGALELGGFDTIGRTGVGFAVEAFQQFVPGEQRVERRISELREEGAGPLEARRAALEFEGEDALPSTNVSLPFRIPLPFGKSLQDIDIGLQGALEALFDPLELLPGGIGLGLIRNITRKTVMNTAKSAAANANSFAAPLREFDQVVAEVVTSENPVIRATIGHTGINPSVLQNTEVGQGLVAYGRQNASAKELTEVAIGAALDSHRAPISGKIPIDINKDGFLGESGKLWNDIFSQEELPSSITGEGRAFIDDFRKVIDEVEQMRVEAGLKPRAKTKEGWYYTPRQANQARDIELLKTSDPNLARIYDEATEGFANGIRYNADPVATLKIHVRQAYKEILNKQLSDYLEPLSITGKEILEETNPAVIRAYEDAIRVAVAKANDIRRMQNQMRRLTIGGGETGTLRVRPSTDQGTTAQQIRRLEARRESLLGPDKGFKASQEEIDKSLRDVDFLLNSLRAPPTGTEVEVGAGFAAKVLRDARALNRKDLQANINKAKDELKDLTLARDKAKRAYTNALEANQKGEIAPGNLFGRAEDEIQVKKWHNRFFPLEDAKKLEEGLGQYGFNPRQANFAADVFGKAVNTSRFLASVGDFAAPFIQGLPLLARNPEVWGRATLRHYQAFFDPTVQSRLMRDYLTEFQEMARHGVPVGDPEFFRALEAGGGFSPGRLLEFLPKGGKEARGCPAPHFWITSQ